MDRLIGKGGDGRTSERLANEGLAPELGDIRAITDEELILVSRVVYATKTVNVPAVKHSIDLELGRRHVAVTEKSVEAIKASTAALVEFKIASAKASNRLETLTKWLIVFTAAVVLLTVVLLAHDLTR
jgi:hypothetical protein